MFISKLQPIVISKCSRNRGLFNTHLEAVKQNNCQKNCKNYFQKSSKIQESLRISLKLKPSNH